MSANDSINNIGNEFLSTAELELQASQERWNKELKWILEKVKLEADLKALYGAKERLLAINQIYLELKLRITSDEKVRKLLLKQLDKNNAKIAKQLQKDKKKNIDADAKLEEKKRKLLDKQLHEERLKLLEEEAELYGHSLGNHFATIMEKEKSRIASEGGFGADLGKSAAKAAGALQKALTGSVDEAMTLFLGKASAINTRLQGTAKTFNEMNDAFESNLGASPYVLYKDAIENLATMVADGVAYNVEQRAFLMTISDKIATTFNAANGTLLKIIRVQQEDSTIYRLGAEAELTSFFNEQFNDSSYMSDVYDSVSLAVADSVALLGTGGGAEFEYQMQKWLGSLYSTGMSSNTLTNLASAINALSTGDVEGVASSGLQNLLVMAANKGNISYADLLTLGVNADNLNVLMSNIVSYWSELAQTNNQVVRKQYADLFGMDMTDMVAIGNINQEALNAIYKESFAYSDANRVLNELLAQVESRMHISELIQNSYQNVLAGIGTEIASSKGMASTWLINNLIKDATGGINIPFITALGTGIGLEADLNSLVNLGIVGAGTLKQIDNITSSLENSGGLNLSAWGAEQYNKHGGTGLSGIVSGVQMTTSGVTTIGNANSDDIQKSTLAAAYNNVDTTVAGEATEEADKMKEAIEDHIDPNIQAILDLLRSVVTGSAINVKVLDYGLTSPF